MPWNTSSQKKFSNTLSGSMGWISVECLELQLDLLKRLLEEALINPDEVHLDAHNPIKYFLKKVNGLWLTVIVLENEVRTAYLITKTRDL
jgi:hypothetical protein